jgi:hydrogenase maturation protease
VAANAILVIGVGNSDRGDDAAGLEAARRIGEAAPAHVRVIECAGDISDLVARLAEADRVILIDACSSGAPAGSVRRLVVAENPLPALGSVSSHGFGLAEAIELARALGQLPASCILYLIEGERFDTGAGISDTVLRGIGEVVDVARRDLSTEA